MTMIIDMDKVELLAMKRCWSWRDLSKEAKVSTQTIYKFRKEQGKIRNKTIWKIAKAFNVDPIDILKD